MSNLLQRFRRNTPGAFDPFRAMNEWLNTPGFDLTNWPTPAFERMERFSPDFDLKESKEGYTIKADVPGVKESDVDVQLQGNQLRISGKRETEREDKGDTYYTCERTSGSFTRLFTLPDAAQGDKARAELKEGVLQVFVPRDVANAPKKVEVKATK